MSEDEASIRKMMELFRKYNPTHTSVRVVMTDKDTVERRVIQDEIP